MPANFQVLEPAIINLTTNSVLGTGASAMAPTLAAKAGKTAYVTGFDITGLGITTAAAVAVSLTDGTVTYNWVMAAVAGATVMVNPLSGLSVKFPEPIPATAVNTAWTLNVPSFGTGNTANSCNLYGYYR